MSERAPRTSDRYVPRYKHTYSLLAVCVFNFLFAILPAPGANSLVPTDKKMILLSAVGSRWGGTEDAFTNHSISLKSNRGNAVWNDRDPDHICLINPENKTYFVQTLEEYTSDLVKKRWHGSSNTKKLSAKEIKLIDGTPAIETMLGPVNESGRQHRLHRVVSIPSVVLPDALARAWCFIMDCPPDTGFVVSLYKQHGKGEQTRDPYFGYALTAPGTRPKAEQTASPGTLWRKLVEYKSVKVLPVQPERFEIPRSYKRAADETAFYFSTEDGVLKKKDLDDIFLSPTK